MNKWLLLILILTVLIIILTCSTCTWQCVTSRCDQVSEVENCTHCAPKIHKCLDSLNDDAPYVCDELILTYKEPDCKSIRTLIDSLFIAFDGESDSIKRIINYIVQQNLIKQTDECDPTELLSIAVDLIAYNAVTTNQVNFSGGRKDIFQQIHKEGTLKHCMCEEGLYIYENPLISMEGEIVRNGNDHLTVLKEGGGNLSLNYIMENGEDYPNKFARPERAVSEMYNNTNKDKVGGPIIAFLDSGIDPGMFKEERYYSNTGAVCINDQNTNHYKGWNFVDDNYITHDDVGHGTLVAQSFKYLMDNNDPYSILPVKVLDSCGYGTMYTTICGLYYAREQSADIINCSWGLKFNDPMMEEAVRKVSQDAYIVCSAGNEALDLTLHEHYPSEYSDLNNSNGFRQVVEVAGLCDNYKVLNPSNKFYAMSNINQINYAESATGYEQMISELDSFLKGNYPECRCEGTSYAAPRITARIAKNMINGIGPMDGLTTIKDCEREKVWAFRE